MDVGRTIRRMVLEQCSGPRKPMRSTMVSGRITSRTGLVFIFGLRKEVKISTSEIVMRVTGRMGKEMD
jgi:hypothetical protein